MNFFSNPPEEKNKIFNEKKKEYSEWRDELQDLNKPFFAVHTDFKHIALREISGGALKLYMFLGFHSKYQTGESWYSEKEIANFFGKDQRTISNWFKELVDRGLIFREQKGFHMKANSFLRPYGFFFEEFSGGLDTDTQFVMNQIDKIQPHNFKYAILLNYVLKEYTLVLINELDAKYQCLCFFDIDYTEIKSLRLALQKRFIHMDNYDVDYSLSSSKNRTMSIYNHLLKYLDGESILTKKGGKGKPS